LFAINAAGTALLTFNSTAPGTIVNTFNVSGLGTGETLRGIDFRPATGQLYCLAVDATTVRIGSFNFNNDSFQSIGSSIPLAPGATVFGFDFDPTIDRLRLTNNTEQNFQINPDDGTVTVQGPSNPDNPTIAGLAYSNNFATAKTTTLYAIDSITDRLYQQAPDTGVLTLVGDLGVNIMGDVGFDIAGDGKALASLTVGMGSQLYLINTTTGAATGIGPIGDGKTIVRDIAVERFSWSGGAGPNISDGNWTAAANWVGNVAPSAGDDLVFPAGVRQTVATNDFPNNTVFNSITITGDNYVLLETTTAFNTVQLSHGITVNVNSADSGAVLNMDFTLLNPQTFVNNGSQPIRINGTIDLHGSMLTVNANTGNIAFGGKVIGAGGITSIGGQTFFIETQGNTYSGPTLIAAGITEITDSAALGAVGVGNETTVIPGASLYITTNAYLPETLELAGSGVGGMGALVCTGIRDGMIWNGPIILEGDTTINTGNSGGLIIGGVISDNGKSPNLIKLGNDALSYSAANTYTGSTNIVAGNLILDGLYVGPVLRGNLTIGNGTVREMFDDQIGDTSSVSILSGGTLDLSDNKDTIGALSVTGGTVMLGIGVLTASNPTLDSASHLDLKINSNSRGIVATGLVNLGGTLTVNLVHPPFDGSTFTIIDNEGTDAVNGSFTGLPEGSILTLSGINFQITYKGGTGNDDVISAIPAAPQVTSKLSLDTPYGQPFSYTLRTTGFPYPSITLLTSSSLPNGVTFVNRGDGTATFFGTPTQGGTSLQHLLVSNGVSPDVDAYFTLGIVQHLIAVGAGPGGEPSVKIYNTDGSVYGTFFAYDRSFRGGVNVAVVDINGDGVDDIITGAGPGGGPHVKVFDGSTLIETNSFFAYDASFRGGVYVAGGHFKQGVNNFFGFVTGAGAGGGPHVKVFAGAFGVNNLANEFFAYDASFHGGVRVATGDVNGDGIDDIITGAGPGGGPHVKVFDGTNSNLLRSFFAYPANFTGGVYVSAGDINGDGKADILTGAGAGGGPQVEVFSGADSGLLQSFYAYDAKFTGGVTVAAADLDYDGKADIITGAGPGGTSHVGALRGTSLQQLLSFVAFDPAFVGGVFVG
jgi:autotransporter-associated beta strand protein